HGRSFGPAPSGPAAWLSHRCTANASALTGRAANERLGITSHELQRVGDGEVGDLGDLNVRSEGAAAPVAREADHHPARRRQGYPGDWGADLDGGAQLLGQLARQAGAWRFEAVEAAAEQAPARAGEIGVAPQQQPALL